MSWVPAVLIVVCGLGLLGVAAGPVAGDEVTVDRTPNPTAVAPGEPVGLTGPVTGSDIDAQSVTFEDQDLTADTVDTVTVGDIAFDGEAALLVTYEENGDLVIAGLETGTLDGDVDVDIEDTGGLVGEHTAHILPEEALSAGSEPGETVSDETADSLVAFDTAVVGIDVTGNGQTATNTVGTLLADRPVLNDIDGDGEFSIFDVQLLFNNLDNPVVEAHPGLFDFAGDDPDDVTVVDVQGLFDFLTAPDDAALAFDDQATASSTFTSEEPTAAGVVVEDVETTVDSAVVVTYEDDELVVAGLDTFDSAELAGNDVTVSVDADGLPGEHTAHVIPVDDLSDEYGPGETVSEETAEAMLDSEGATVFEGTVEFADQTVTGPVAEGETLATIETADLLDGVDDDTTFVADVHPTDDEGELVGTEFVGSSEVLTGTNEDVEITAEQVPDGGEFNEFPLEGVDEFVAMVHLVDDSEEGDETTPGEFPALPNADAEDGFVSGGVTDDGAVEIVSDAQITGNIMLDFVDPDEDVTVTVALEGTDNSTEVLLSGEENSTGYTIEDVEPDEYTVSATSDSENYVDPDEETVVVEGEEIVEVDLAFERLTGGADGTVVASGETATDQTPGEGEGVENATLEVYAFQESADGEPTFTFEDATDEAGAFELPVDTFPVGDHFVEVSAAGFAPAGLPVNIEEGENSLGELGLDYADGGAISGEITLDVVDPDEDVTVTVELAETDDSTTVTLAGGETSANYTIEGVDVTVEDGYTVTAEVTGDAEGNYGESDPAEYDIEVDVGETVEDNDFAFERLTGGADGTVVASGETATDQTPAPGEGIENATLEVYAFQESADGEPTFTFEDATDETGAFELPVDTFPVGEHFVEVSAAGFASAGLPVTIEEGENNLGEIGLDYADGGAISGEITLDAADAGEDVTVTVALAETDDSTTVTLPGGETSANYTLADVDVNVEDGYTVTASEDTGNYATPDDVEDVTVGIGETAEIDLGFERLTGDLDGTVTNADGGAFEGILVEVSAFGPEGPVVASDTTNAAGGYAIDDLPVGEHSVTASLDGSVGGQADVEILADETVTQDFEIAEANFEVEILDDEVGTAAGAEQSFDVAVENTGELPGEQEIELDWGGEFTDSETIELDGGENETVTLAVETAEDQPLGGYDVTVASEDATDETTARIGPTRSLNQSLVAPGETVQVTVSGELDEGAPVNFADAWTPDADDSEIVSVSYPSFQGASENDAFATSDGDVEPGTVEIVYNILVPEDEGDQTYEWDPLEDGDGSAMTVDGVDLSIFGDQEFEVTTDGNTAVTHLGLVTGS